MHRLVIAAAVAASFAVPAFAQNTTTEFYVVHDASTKKCMIVDKKPTTTTTTTVVGNTVYKTRTEAENGMKTIKDCS